MTCAFETDASLIEHTNEAKRQLSTCLVIGTDMTTSQWRSPAQMKRGGDLHVATRLLSYWRQCWWWCQGLLRSQCIHLLAGSIHLASRIHLLAADRNALRVGLLRHVGLLHLGARRPRHLHHGRDRMGRKREREQEHRSDARH